MKTMQSFKTALWVVLLLFAVPASAQTSAISREDFQATTPTPTVNPQPTPPPIPLPSPGIWSPFLGDWTVRYFDGGLMGANRIARYFTDEEFQAVVQRGQQYEDGYQFYEGNVTGYANSTVNISFNPNELVWVEETNEFVRVVYVTLRFSESTFGVRRQEFEVSCTCYASMQANSVWGAMLGRHYINSQSIDVLHSSVAGWKPSVYGNTMPPTPTPSAGGARGR